MSFFGVFFQVIGHGLSYCLLYGSINLAVTQLRLSLTFELRLCHFNRDNGSQTLTEVVLGHFNLGFLNLLTQLIVLVSVLFQRTSQSDAETCQVSTTLYSVDIINVGVDIFGIVTVIEQGYFNGNTVFLSLQTNGVAND